MLCFFMKRNNLRPDVLDCKTGLSFPTNLWCGVVVSCKKNVVTGKGKCCGLFGVLFVQHFFLSFESRGFWHL